MSVKNQFTEGIFSSIAKALSFGAMRKHLRKIEKMAKNDPELKAELENIKKLADDKNDKLKIFCREFPEHFLCGGNKNIDGKIHKSKVKITW